MNLNKYIFELLIEVRKEYSIQPELNDEIAMNIIKDKIFTMTFVSKLSLEEIDLIINTVFYKTRRRLGILQPLIDDPNISEIMVNGPDNVFIEKGGKLIRHNVCFENVKELEDVMQNIAGDVHREINELNPIVDCRLMDGSRVNGVYKNVAVNGPILTIRKFSESFLTMKDLISNGTINEEGAKLLEYLVISGYNIFVSGGTSTGKTTFLNALAYSIPKNERVIVIEDSMELKLTSVENIVHMESKKGNQNGVGKVTMSDLIKSSLRMRPDRIIVGEIRGDEVIPMLQAMNTGHNGSLSTGHANSVSGMLKRIETMYLSSMPISLDAIRLQIAEGIDIMVHLERLSSGKRVVSDISEIVSYENNEFVINNLMKYENSELKRTDNKIISTRKVILKGKEVTNELRKDGFIVWWKV